MRAAVLFSVGHHLWHRWSRHQGWRLHGWHAQGQVWCRSCCWLLPGKQRNYAADFFIHEKIKSAIFLYSCDLYTVNPWHMKQDVRCNHIRHITETVFICPTTSFWNPSFLIGFSQAEAQTSEGCGIYGHGEEQCWSRWAWPSFHHILHFSNFPVVSVFTCLLSDCYVADELVVSRAGRRVRVGNTDAEGRMVMVDLLCEMKEKVLL